MRARTAVFVAATLSLLVFAARAFGPLSPAARETIATPRAEPVAETAPQAAPGWGPLPTRNIFEYADAPGAFALPAGEAPPVVEPDFAPILPPPVRVRLVGLVGSGSDLLAALALEGEVVLLGPGGQHAGYRVVAVDREAGVRLEGPEGSLLLEPPD